MTHRSSRVLARLHNDAWSRSMKARSLHHVPPRLRAVLEGVAATEEHLVGLIIWWAATPAMAVAAALIFGGWWAVVVVFVMGLLPIFFVAHRSGRKAQLLVAALPETVDIIGRSLRSGATLTQALAEVAAAARPVVAHELQGVLHEIQVGRPAAIALQAWAERIPRSEVRIVAAALALASEHEAGTTRALDGVSQTLRDRAALAGEIRALTSQAVTSMRALSLLPVGFLLLDALSDQRVLRYLLGEPLGRVCLATGVAFNLIGAAWMHAIVERRLPT